MDSSAPERAFWDWNDNRAPVRMQAAGMWGALMRKRILIGVLALSVIGGYWLYAQTKILPDCDIPFTFTGSGNSQITGCAQNVQGVRFWAMTYQSVGFSGVTLTVQEAPDAGG